MTSRPGRARAAATAAALVAAAILLAACGGAGSHHAGNGSSAGSTSTAIAFSRCMRNHGLPQFPDVQSGGGLPIEHTDNGGVEIIINGVGQPVSGPAFRTAMGKCGHYVADLFGSPVSSSQASRIHQALLQDAECMRSHGVPQYPDPMLPGHGTGHMSPTARAEAAGVNIYSPAFRAAVRACGQALHTAVSGGG